MKSIRINIRALTFDGKTPLSAKDRLIFNSTTGSYDVVGPDGSPLRSFGLLRSIDLAAREVIATTDHLFVSAAEHSGEAGAKRFSARSCHVALGKQVATSPTRESDPSGESGEVGPFALGHRDELELTCDGKGEQSVTIAALVGSAVAIQSLGAAAHESPRALAFEQVALPDDTTDLDATTLRHGLLPKLSGNTSQFLRGDGAWGSVGSGGPTTVYELDWSAQASQLGIGDGTVTIDGIDWTAANTANSTLFQILNGSGLQITAVSGVNRSCNNGITWYSDAPRLHCELEALAIECARYDLPLTIWSYYTAYSVPTPHNSVLAGVGGPSAPYSAWTSGVNFMNWQGVGPGIKRGGGHSRAANPIATHDVLVWQSIIDGLFQMFSGEWSGDWPERNQLQLVGRDVKTGNDAFSTVHVLRHPGIALIYAVETNSGLAGAPSFTLARTRIQIG